MTESSPKNPTVELIVTEYLSSRLKKFGIPDWPVAGDQVDGQIISTNGHSTNGNSNGHSVDTENLEKIQSSLETLTTELLGSSGSEIKQLASNFNRELPPTPFIDYSSFEKLSSALFLDGLRWSHVLTLLVFGSELAHERSKHTTEKSELLAFLNHVSEWLIRCLSSQQIATWINSQEGWNGLVTYASEQKSTGEGSEKQDSENNHDSSEGENSINGLRAAISLATQHANPE